MKTLRAVAVLVGVIVLAGADWARFRGPNGTGTADGTGIPEKWTVAKDALWTVELPGPGNGSPIVCGGKVYLQAATADAAKRMLVCYDAKTGHKDWEAPVSGHKPPDKGMHAKNSLASSTPACDGERVYCVFWDGTDFSLHVFDLAGKPVWYKNFGEYKSQHGVGSSPVLHEGKVFLNFDQDGAAELVALDAKTGDPAWSMKRKAFRACYSSPFVRDLPGGQTELVVDSTQGVTAYDPATGKVNWTWDWVFSNASLRTVGGPLMVGDVIVAISGDGDGSRDAVAISAGPGAKRLWGTSGAKRGSSPYVPMPVAKGDYLYWVHDKGRAACVEARTGKELWNESLPNISREISASLILTGDRVTAIAEDGKVYVFKASPKEYESLWRTSIGETVFATPAVADGKLFIRTAGHLICIGSK